MMPHQFPEPILEILSYFQRVPLKLLLFDHIQHCQTNRARHRVSAEAVEVLHSVIERRCDLGCRNDRRHRMTVSERLSDSHDVRHNPLRLKRPVVRTKSAKPGLHFVSDANAACLASVPISFLQIPVRKNYLTSATQR